MKNLHNKVAVVTGAGSGMGRALALRFADAGVKLAISDYNADTLAETKQLVEQKGGKVMTRVFDVSDKTKMHEFAEEVFQTYGQVDIMINNAGVALGKVTLEDLTYEEFEWIVGINMWGMIYGSKAFLPYLKKRPEGSIVNLSSLFGLIGIPYQVPYCTTKFAIRGFNEALRLEMAAEKIPITITSVHPGGIQTNISRSSRRASTTPKEEHETNTRKFEKLFITSADEAARQIIAAIQKKKVRLVIGGDAKRPDLLARLFPSSYGAIVRYFLQKFDKQKS